GAPTHRRRPPARQSAWRRKRCGDESGGGESLGGEHPSGFGSLRREQSSRQIRFALIRLSLDGNDAPKASVHGTFQSHYWDGLIGHSSRAPQPAPSVRLWSVRAPPCRSAIFLHKTNPPRVP